MRAQIARTVLFAALGLGCATPAKEQPAKPTRSGAPAASPPVASAPEAVRAATAAPSASVHVSTESKTGSAYFGCGQPIPVKRLWDETTESQVLEAIGDAKRCAAEHGRRLLLEFVAPWCDDCHEMARLDETPAVAQTLRARFERVRVNVGKWDRHEALRKNYDVRALATYIVIDPRTSRLLAKTTLEPITKPGKKLKPEDWAAWLGAQ